MNKSLLLLSVLCLGPLGCPEVSPPGFEAAGPSVDSPPAITEPTIIAEPVITEPLAPAEGVASSGPEAPAEGFASETPKAAVDETATSITPEAPVEYKLLIPLDWFQLPGAEIEVVPGENKLILKIPTETIEEGTKPESRLLRSPSSATLSLTLSPQGRGKVAAPFWRLPLEFVLSLVSSAYAQTSMPPASPTLRVEVICNRPCEVVGGALLFRMKAGEVAQETPLFTIHKLENTIAVAIDRVAKDPTQPLKETLAPTLLLTAAPMAPPAMGPAAPTVPTGPIAGTPPIAPLPPQTIHDKEEFQRLTFIEPLQKLAELKKSALLPAGTSWTDLTPAQETILLDQRLGEKGGEASPGMGATALPATGATGLPVVIPPVGPTVALPLTPPIATLAPLAVLPPEPSVILPPTMPPALPGSLEAVHELIPIRREFFSSHPWIQAEMASGLDQSIFPQMVARRPPVSISNERRGKFGLLAVNGTWFEERQPRAAMVDFFDAEASTTFGGPFAHLSPVVPEEIRNVHGLKFRLARLALGKEGEASHFEMVIVVNGGERKETIDLEGRAGACEQRRLTFPMELKVCGWRDVSVPMEIARLSQLDWILRSVDRTAGSHAMEAVGIDHIEAIW